MVFVQAHTFTHGLADDLLVQTAKARTRTRTIVSVAGGGGDSSTKR